MKARQVILDTNVLVSAFLSAKGTCRRLLEQLTAENAVLLFSQETYEEFTSRIVRPKFAKYVEPKTLEHFVGWLADVATFCEPEVRVVACRDSDDDKFLSLAIAANADVIVSGDDDLLVLHPFEGVDIVKPADFLNHLV